MTDHGVRFYLNKKSRSILGMIRLTLKGASMPDGYLIRYFDFDDKIGKFAFDHEDMVPVESGERKLQWLRGNADWAPVSTETAEKFIDYKAVPKSMRQKKT